MKLCNDYVVCIIGAKQSSRNNILITTINNRTKKTKLQEQSLLFRIQIKIKSKKLLINKFMSHDNIHSVPFIFSVVLCCLTVDLSQANNTAATLHKRLSSE